MVDSQLIENKEASWTANGITIHGTITYPSEKNARCGVVFVAGSGPTDRDWCSPLLPGTNGSAKLIAEVLAQEGYASIRYDKAATGPDAQQNVIKLAGKVSMQTHLEEVSGAIQALAESGKVDGHCIFALTNSEGAVHAINYQLQAKNLKLKGLILTGAPGRSIGTVARGQIQAQVKELPNGEEIMKSYDTAIADFVAEKPITPDPALPEMIQHVLMSLAFPVNLPFTRELWVYDSAKTIGAIDVPLLVVIGKKDVQADWEADGKALEAVAAKNPDASFVYPENANHVLKYEPTPREQLSAQSALQYNAEDTQLDKETVSLIVDWLKKHAR
jgi:pimeloyl-ACP methyl ester carboxylesterase